MRNIRQAATISKGKQPWLRLYRSSLHNPKIVTLSDRQHRAWHNCLLISDNNGVLPSPRDIATHMRMTMTEAEQLICELVEAGLIDPVMAGSRHSYVLHDWTDHQHPSDHSSSRMKNLRARRRDGVVTARDRHGDGSVLKSDVTDTDTDTDSEVEVSIHEEGVEVDTGGATCGRVARKAVRS